MRSAPGSIVKAGSLRTTLHVMSAAEFPYLASAYVESERGRTEGLGVDVEVLRAALPDEPITSAELFELGHRVLGTDDRWTVAFAYRALPFVRTRAGRCVAAHEAVAVRPLACAAARTGESAIRVVRQYLAAYGPATRDDVVQYTSFKVATDRPGARRTADARGRRGADALRRSARAACRRRCAAPVRFLPAFDSIILAHRDRSRIVPPEYVDAVFNKRNATTKNTFTVDGFVAGAWRVERRRLVLEPFAPLPPRVRREVDAEGERLLAWYLG